MKVKASITLSDTMVKAIDKIIGKRGNRSAFIEEALQYYITQSERAKRDARDLEILNARDWNTKEEKDFAADMAYFSELALKSWDEQERAEKRQLRSRARRKKS